MPKQYTYKSTTPIQIIEPAYFLGKIKAGLVTHKILGKLLTGGYFLMPHSHKYVSVKSSWTCFAGDSKQEVTTGAKEADHFPTILMATLPIADPMGKI